MSMVSDGHDVDFGKGGLTVLQHIAGLPRWPDDASDAQRVNLLFEEAVIRDEFMSYAYAYDNHDLDAVLRHFSTDCVIDNPRGQVAGAAEIRANYRVLLGYWSLTRTLWSNVTVRILDASATQAFVVAYHYAMLISDERRLAGAGVDIRRLDKTDGRWLISRRWITDDVDFTIDVFHGAVEDPTRVVELLQQADSD